MGFKDEMEQHDDQFETDKASAGRLPDGRYTNAVITESRIDHDESSDTYTWVMRFEADFDTPTGVAHNSVRKWYNLDHEVGRSIAAQDAKRFGYEGKLSELEDANEKEFFLGFVCDIKVETKAGDEREFTNVYVNKVLGKTDVEGGQTQQAVAAGTDDDIPF